VESDAVPQSLRAAGVTPRELETFWLVADRLHNREIAERLHLSERTVESHVSALLRKLGGANRQSLIDAAARLRDGVGTRALPRPLSSFVGRGQQLDELLRLVTRHQLVTMTGPAGAGKTRLALQLARLADRMPDPALVDLASVPPDGPVDGAVERAFADALGVESDGRALRPVLRQALSEDRRWLVVDNCEHVTAAVAGLLAELLSATTRLTVLATSHGPLRVAGEVVYEVPPLELPPDTDDPAEALGAAAVRLFADRAEAAAPGFTVNAANARDVATVCRRLDGLPLAIELAAARIRLFSPAELVGHLDDRFALLTDGARGGPSRHRTLEEALRWSYDLLDQDERLLLDRCSVFPGGFDFDTAAGILGYPPLHPADLARILPRLLDRSLLAVRRRDQTTEYRLLDSIRQFAHRELAARAEVETARAAHARYHLRHGPTLLPDLRGANQISALTWFERRWADVGAAIGWAVAHDEHILAWEFLAGVGTGWEIIGVRAELFDWLDTLLDAPLPDGSLGVRAAVTAAVLLCFQDVKRARTFAELASERATDGAELSLAKLAVGWVGRFGEPAGRDELAEAAVRFQRDGDAWHHALTLAAMGLDAEDPEPGFTNLARAAELFGRLRDHVKRANTLNQLAMHAVRTGIRLDEAGDWLIEARLLAVRTGNRHEWLHAEVFQASLDQSLGDHAAAAARFAGLLAEFRRIGDRRCTIRCLRGLGRAALHDGDRERARPHLSAAADLAASIGEERVAAEIRDLVTETDPRTKDR
jgi:predicted ATPase/DNA-binding CsgD family transcriptional regulator